MPENNTLVYTGEVRNVSAIRRSFNNDELVGVRVEIGIELPIGLNKDGDVEYKNLTVMFPIPLRDHRPPIVGETIDVRFDW